MHICDTSGRWVNGQSQIFLKYFICMIYNEIETVCFTSFSAEALFIWNINGLNFQPKLSLKTLTFNCPNYVHDMRHCTLHEEFKMSPRGVVSTLFTLYVLNGLRKYTYLFSLFSPDTNGSNPWHQIHRGDSTSFIILFQSYSIMQWHLIECRFSFDLPFCIHGLGIWCWFACVGGKSWRLGDRWIFYLCARVCEVEQQGHWGDCFGGADEGTQFWNFYLLKFLWKYKYLIAFYIDCLVQDCSLALSYRYHFCNLNGTGNCNVSLLGTRTFLLHSINTMKAENLTHWGRVMHICIGKLTIIGSDNGLLPGRHQSIIWTNAMILLIRPSGTNFNEILIEIYVFSFKKMHLKVSSAKRRPFCLGLNVLRTVFWYCSVCHHSAGMNIE